jgi:hypothetical protein
LNIILSFENNALLGSDPINGNIHGKVIYGDALAPSFKNFKKELNNVFFDDDEAISQHVGNDFKIDRTAFHKS